VIGLLTSRLVLKALGVDDFGLYNVVGGIVVIFSILNQALSTGTSRFLTFELGVGDLLSVKKVFSTSFIIHALMALFIFILTETIGLWCVNNYLVIPDGRLVAANWVYQFSILSCMFSLTQVPYASILLAHEKFNIYAMVGIVEAIFKLLLIFLLLHIQYIDRLILYGFLYCLSSIIIQLFYRYYCTRSFHECKLIIVKEKNLYIKIISFSFWNLIGAFSWSGVLSLISIFINLFFGVRINAAYAVALQIESAVTIFSNQFISAVVPQIIKLYAENNIKKMLALMTEASKYAYFLLLVISMPLFIEINYILGVWLTEVPEHTASFIRIALITRLAIAPNILVCRAIEATGDVKWMNLITGILSILQVLFIYIFYKVGYPVESGLIIRCILLSLCTLLQLIPLKKTMPQFGVLQFIKQTYIIFIVISLFSFLLQLVLFNILNVGFIRLLLLCAVSIISIGILVFFIGMNMNDRKKIIGIVIIKLQEYKIK
jgi:O-antigen/teichoic acid export membrane protein